MADQTDDDMGDEKNVDMEEVVRMLLRDILAGRNVDAQKLKLENFFKLGLEEMGFTREEFGDIDPADCPQDILDDASDTGPTLLAVLSIGAAEFFVANYPDSVRIEDHESGHDRTAS